MADISTVIQNLRADGEFIEASNLPDVQFVGPRRQRYLGAELLPEQLRDANQYDEEDFHLLDLMAADVDAYSPPPFMGVFARAGAFNVRMGDSGLATQMPTKTYSDITKLLQTNASMERVAAAILRWNDVITAAMLTYNERQRWNAIVLGEVVRKIAQTEEAIVYPDAAGQRTALVGEWSDPDYDPMADLFSVRSRATSLGYSGVRRIITSRAALDILLNNPHVQRRIGQVSIVGDQEYIDYADESRLRGYLSANGLPSIETYDEMWRSQSTSGRYFPEDVMVFVYNTGRTIEDIMELEEEIYVPDNQGAGLGYTGIGTPAGHEDLGPGRWQDLVYNGGSRPNISAEGVQKSLPVFSDPNSFSLFTAIR